MTPVKTLLVLNLNEVAQGKLDREGFSAKLSQIDWGKYDGADVAIRGCAPTWAHLMVAGRLFGKVKSLSFLMDDGKGGVPIQIFP